MAENTAVSFSHVGVFCSDIDAVAACIELMQLAR